MKVVRLALVMLLTIANLTLFVLGVAGIMASCLSAAIGGEGESDPRGTLESGTNVEELPPRRINPTGMLAGWLLLYLPSVVLIVAAEMLQRLTRALSGQGRRRDTSPPRA